MYPLFAVIRSLPALLQTDRFGELALAPIAEGSSLRASYSPRNKLDFGPHRNVQLTVFSPELGIANAEKFVIHIQSVWDAMLLNYETEMLSQAEPFVSKLLDGWWHPEVPPADAAREVLRSALIQYVHIETDHPHEIQFWDRTTHFSGRDVWISFDSKLRPISARLDG